MRGARILFCVAVVVLAQASGLWAGPLYTNDLLVYYSFDDPGNLTADGSVHDYDGTIARDVTYSSAGVSGGAARFADRAYAGQNPDDPAKAMYDYNYIALPAANIFADGNIPRSNFTVAAWCNITAKTGDNQGDHYTIFGPKTSEGTYVVHAELRPRDGYPWGNETPDCRFVARAYDADGSNGGAGNNIGDLKAEMADADGFFDGWHHVAMTYDRSASTMEIFLDGELIAEKTDCPDLLMAQKWDAGAYVGANPQPARQFYGLMDEFYLFNRTLSEAEIGALASVSASSDVPEPSSIALLLGAIASAVFYWWKRRR